MDGKRGERYVLFPKRLGKTLKAYIGHRRTGYVFVDSKPFQNLSPMRAASGGWQCRWRKYNEKGEWVGIGSGFVPVAKRWSCQEARRYFAHLARRDRVRR